MEPNYKIVDNHRREQHEAWRYHKIINTLYLKKSESVMIRKKVLLLIP
jgi:hypothetical protein